MFQKEWRSQLNAVEKMVKIRTLRGKVSNSNLVSFREWWHQKNISLNWLRNDWDVRN